MKLWKVLAFLAVAAMLATCVYAGRGGSWRRGAAGVGRLWPDRNHSFE